MIYDLPLIGSAARASWYAQQDNICSVEADVFKNPHEFLFIGNAAAPTAGAPWTFTMDFQSAMALETFYWHIYSTDEPPSDLKIYGSATGAFAGEETLIETLTGIVSTSADEYVAYAIGTPQSFRYYKFEILSFVTPSTKPSYFYGISFEFGTGDFTFNTVTEYVEPLNKIEGTDWIYCLRDDVYVTDYETRCKALLSLFVEDLGWDVDIITYPSKLLLKSDGLNNDQPWGYIVCEIYSAGELDFQKAYGYWDATAKTGSMLIAQGSSYASDYSNVEVQNSDPWTMICRGNRDLFQLVAPNHVTGSYDRGMSMMGHWPRNSDLTPAHTTFVGAEVAATAPNILVASSAGFEVGGYYMIWGTDGEGQDYGVLCTAIPDATHVTIDSLPRGYSAGSFIGNSVMNFFRKSGAMYNLGHGKKSGLVEPTTADVFELEYMGYGFRMPDGIQNKKILAPLMVRNNASVQGGISVPDKILCGDYGAEQLYVYLIGTVNPRDIGTVTSAAAKTLTDTAKAWTINEHAGRYAYISAGTGYSLTGNFIKIVSNTADTLTVEYDWIDALAVGDSFSIADEIWQSGVDYDLMAFKCGGA